MESLGQERETSDFLLAHFNGIFLHNEVPNKLPKVGFMQALRHSGETWMFNWMYGCLYRPVDPATGQRVKNPFDGYKGNGTGGTSKTLLKLKGDPTRTIYSVSFSYYRSLLSYTPSETLMGQFLEPLAFLRWYLIVAINMLVAYPLIRTMQNTFPELGNKLKNWYATTPVCEEIDCAVKN